MPNTYQVREGGESLVARLIEDNGRQIELTYINVRGDSQVGIYDGGLEVSRRATMADGELPGSDNSGASSLFGHLAAYDRLGPRLREQIPQDWHVVLGEWLLAKRR